MVIRVEYYIPKKYFIKHKEEFKKLIYKQDFEVAYLKFMMLMSDREIAKQLGISYFMVRKILSNSLEKIRKIT